MSEHRMLSNCLLLLSEHDSSKGRWPGFVQSGPLLRFELLYIGTQDGIQVNPCSPSPSPLHSCWTLLHLLLFEHGLFQAKLMSPSPWCNCVERCLGHEEPTFGCSLSNHESGSLYSEGSLPVVSACMSPLALLLVAMLWSSMKCSLGAERMLKLQNCEPKSTSFLY